MSDLPQDPYHYAVIARALNLIDEGGPTLTLDDLARRMGMSTAHFQRVFSHWVGVSPKRYQQYLTLDHARHLLADRFTVLDTSLATGLSGGGRLHDLFLRWEAMTPGEFARGGAGLQIFWGYFDSPFGPALVMGTAKGICGIAFAAETGEAEAMADLRARWPKAEFIEAPERLHDLFLRWEAMTPGEFAQGGAGLQISWGRFDSPFGPALVMGTTKGICGIAFTTETGEAGAVADLQARWPKAHFVEDPDRLRDWVQTAFGQDTVADPAPIYLIGAPFQIKVWEALLRIPSGQVTTYSDIASAVGHPKAVRAVGTAVGRNPVSWRIPCHRALRKSGGLGGYHWGLPVKRAMLAWEAARSDAA